MAKATAELFKNRIVGYDTKPADQFTANPLNYRKHPQRQRDAVNASLRELGWISTVVENVTTGNVIDGHERIWQALQRNEDVPYLKVELSEAEERLALAVFDPITNMAETDAAILDDLLREVNTGEAALQALLAEMAEGLTTPADGDWMAAFEGSESKHLDTVNVTFVLPKDKHESVMQALQRFDSDKNQALILMAKSCLS